MNAKPVLRNRFFELGNRAGEWIKHSLALIAPGQYAWRGAVLGLLLTAAGLSALFAAHNFLAPPRLWSALKLIDASTHEMTDQLPTSVDMQTVRFSPDGRWGFALSPTHNTVDVIDATTNRVIDSLTVDGAPDKVSFTSSNAYIHVSQKPVVLLVDLNQISQTDEVAAVSIIGGQTAPDQSPFPLSAADAIVPVHPHGGHILIANPGDQTIYYYMEGMNAPMGSFQTYNRTPRAVLVADRSISEKEPGTYSAEVKIPHGGSYEVALSLDQPRLIHCFTFTTEAKATASDYPDGTTKIESLSNVHDLKIGETFTLKVRLTDAITNEPLPNLSDVYILAAEVSGQRNDRYQASRLGKGEYQADLIFATPGLYNVYFSIPSRNINIDDVPHLVLRVTKGK